MNETFNHVSALTSSATHDKLIAALAQLGFDPASAASYQVPLPDGRMLTVRCSTPEQDGSSKAAAKARVFKRPSDTSCLWGFDDKEIEMPYSVNSLRYARILSTPYQSIDHVVLANLESGIETNHRSMPGIGEILEEAYLAGSSVVPFGRWTWDPVADEEATETYGKYLADLNEEIEEADEWRDYGRSEALKKEKDRFLQFVLPMYTPFGKPRAVEEGNHDEKAYDAIRKSLCRGRQELREAGHEKLAAYLEKFVALEAKGYVYRPENDAPEWDISLRVHKSYKPCPTYVPPVFLDRHTVGSIQKGDSTGVTAA